MVEVALEVLLAVIPEYPVELAVVEQQLLQDLLILAVVLAAQRTGTLVGLALVAPAS